MKKTKIVATIGPKTDNIEALKELILNGMDVARINLSHATQSYCLDIKSKIDKLNEEMNKNIAIMLDMSGPDIRIDKFKDGSAFLKKNDKIRIYMNEILGDETKFSISYNLINKLNIDNLIKLNDGLITLKVCGKGMDYLLCEVINEGMIYDNKSVNVPGIRLERNFLTEKDKSDIEFANKYKFDFLALSFVSSMDDVLEVDDILIENENNHTQIISKIECQNALDEIEEIVKLSDGVMIARGDLGVEIPLEKVPIIQKKITGLCHEYGKICIVATEMLSSMEENNRPTRAEVSDVANAIIDGVDAVMLSGETTIGRYPIEAINMMQKIIVETEDSIDYLDILDNIKNDTDITETIAYTVVESACTLNCKAIITPTESGYTARKISRYKPTCPIIAVSPNIDTVKSLMLNFGVIPILIDELNSLDKILNRATKEASKILDLKSKDKVVITGGYPFRESRHTNFMKIEEL